MDENMNGNQQNGMNAGQPDGAAQNMNPNQQAYGGQQYYDPNQQAYGGQQYYDPKVHLLGLERVLCEDALEHDIAIGVFFKHVVESLIGETARGRYGLSSRMCH